MKNPFDKTQILLLVCAIFVSLSLGSCKDEEQQEAGAEAKVTDFLPTSAKKGTMLTLNGENLGASPKGVRVWINDNEVEVINVTQKKINVRVPVRAGSGTIKVSIGGIEHVYPTQFEYLTESVVSTLAGTGEQGYVDGLVDNAKFHNLSWLAYDPKDDIVYTLETDFGSTPHRMRRIKNGVVETVVNFPTASVKLNNPRSIEFSVTGDTIFISNDNGNNPTANPHAVAITTRADDFKVLKAYLQYPAAKTEHVNFAGINPVDGTLVYYCWPGKIYAWDQKNSQAILLADVLPVFKTVNSGLTGSYGSLRFSPDGKQLYMLSRNDYQGILRADYNMETKTLDKPFERFAGTGTWGSNDGQGVAAGMDQPSQGVFGSDGNLYTVERFNHIIRRVSPSGQVIKFFGASGAGYVEGESAVAKFNEPFGLVIDKHGNFIVADRANNRVRIIKEDE